MRLFIAINFNGETRGRLSALCDTLRDGSARGNFSLSENLHLTLAFLGECDDKQTAAAKKAMDAISFEPFDTRIERVGLFKRGGGSAASAIWWAGMREDEPLINLQRDLAVRLINAGFDLDSRKYSPHITIGREVVTDVKPWPIEPFGERADKIELMKSERVNGKLTYTAIYAKYANITVNETIG
jgi:2'-5' RNA ligase